jgi:hypothetical protein
MAGKIFQLNLNVPSQALGAIFNSLKVDGRQWFPMTIKVPESELGAILSGLVTHGVKLSSVDPTGEVDTAPRGYVGGKRNKGITGKELIMALLTGDESYGGERRIWKGDEISKAFVKNGFAGGSWSPPMSELVKEDPPKVRFLGKGMYCVMGLTLRPEDIPD